MRSNIYLIMTSFFSLCIELQVINSNEQKPCNLFKMSISTESTSKSTSVKKKKKMYLKRNAAPQAKFCSALCWKWLVIWSQLLSEAGASTWSCSSRLQVTAGRLIYRLSWKHASPSGPARWSQAMICWTSNSKRSGENVTGQAVTTVPSCVGLPAEISTCNVLNISRHWINSKRSRRFRTLTDTAGGWEETV